MDPLGIRSRLAVLRRLSGAHPYNRSRRARAKEVAAWRAFDSVAVARGCRREHVLGIGDSHLAALPDVVVPGLWIRTFGIGGATASGIQNPASRTRAREIFEARLALAPRWQHLVLGLGEVDCGFVIWHRAKAQGLDVTEQLEVVLDRYASFIEAVFGSGFRSVSVLSATLPTVPSYGEASGNPAIAARNAIDVPLRERTALTQLYNDGLADRCRALGATFFDTTSEQLDPGTGMVSEKLTVKDDPHLNLSGYAEILSRVLAGPRAPWNSPVQS